MNRLKRAYVTSDIFHQRLFPLFKNANSERSPVIEGHQKAKFCKNGKTDRALIGRNSENAISLRI